MVAPPFVAATSATVDGGRNLTLGRPTGTSANDALLAFVSINGGSASGSPSVTPPAGWTQVHLTRSGYSTLQTFTRTAGSSEPASYTFTLPANDDMVGVLAAYRAGAVDVSAQYSSEGDSSAYAPTVTTTGADRTVLSAYASGTSIDSTPPSGTTVRGDEWSAGVYASLLVVDYEQATAGTTDLKTATYSSVTDWATQTIALYATNTAPNAPILLSPGDASLVDRNVSQRFDWDFSDPDAGDSQSAYNFRYRAVGAATWTETGWQASTQTYHDVSGGTFADGTDYEWQAATKDAQGVEGPFSASWFFTAGTAPTPPTITAPTNGGTFLQTQTVAWSTPDQGAYQIRVMDGTTVVSDTGTVTSSTARSASVEFPTNGVTRTIQLRVSDGGLWSQWAEVTGTVSWLAPPAPTFTLAADDASGSLGISISNPAPSGSEPAASYNDVFVDDGAGEFRMATNVAPNGSVTYWLPKSGRDYASNVRVRAIAENGVYADS